MEMNVMTTSGSTIQEAHLQAARAMDRAMGLGKQGPTDAHLQWSQRLDHGMGLRMDKPDGEVGVRTTLQAATNPMHGGSMRSALREQALEWMAANPGRGRPHFQVQSKDVLHPEDPVNTPQRPYQSPPSLGVALSHSEWVDTITELETDFGPDVLTAQPELAQMACFSALSVRSGMSIDEAAACTAKKFGRKFGSLQEERQALLRFQGDLSKDRALRKLSAKSLKAAAKKDARLKKKGGSTSADVTQREHLMNVRAMRILQEDLKYNKQVREHNRTLQNLRSDVEANGGFVLDLGAALGCESKPTRNAPRGPSPNEPRVVEIAAEDRVAQRFKSWGLRLQKVQRHHDRETAKNTLQSEKRADIRAACDALAAAKAAAGTKLSKPGVSGPTRKGLWAEELPGVSDQSKAKGKKAVSLEKGAEHEQTLEDKEQLRISQLLEQKEARRKAFEIGGSW